MERFFDITGSGRWLVTAVNFEKEIVHVFGENGIAIKFDPNTALNSIEQLKGKDKYPEIFFNFDVWSNGLHKKILDSRLPF